MALGAGSSWTRGARTACAASVIALCSACNGLLGNSEHAVAADASAEGSLGDSPYRELAGSDGRYWQELPLRGGLHFQGGAFDGRYVYFSPTSPLAPSGGFGAGSPVKRYDTRGDFTSAASWASFDTASVGGAGVSSFLGAVFDGRYVYFAPMQVKPGTHAVFMRFDTTSKFELASSWEAFDVTMNVAQRADGYGGGTFDGRYVYFAPWPNTSALRFDTQGTFKSKSSWEVFDVTLLDATASGMQGAVFDGRFVYLIPLSDAGFNQFSDLLVRYDTKKAFGERASWEAQHLLAFNPDATGFIGGAYDGQYLYLAAYSSYLGTVPRFDTKGAGLGAIESWKFFSVQENVTRGGAGFCGAGFDGRFVYFVPNQSLAYDGVLVRVDSLGTFDDKGSWSFYDMAHWVNPAATGYCGAVFDGEYMYFVPAEFGIVTRFRARDAPQLPPLPHFHGSFL